jgi:hypothetical protein
MATRTSIILAGGLGGMAPTLFQIGSSLVAGKAILGSIPGVFLGSLVLAGLGAIAAWVYKETDLAKAFALGIGLPALFTAVTSGSSGLPQKDGSSEQKGGKHQSVLQQMEPAPAFSLFSTPAFAESALVQAQAPRIPAPETGDPSALPDSQDKMKRIVRLTLHKLPDDAEVVFSSENGQEIPVKLRRQSGEHQELAIPDSAFSLQFRSKSLDIQSSAFALPRKRGAKPHFSVGLQSQFWESFKKTLGFNQAKPLAFEVSLPDHPGMPPQ